jgi:hypothetical protein
LSLRPDPRDAVETALRHRRWDLFYGSHYLRFTKTHRDDGTIHLRLQERARLVADGSTRPQLRAADQLPSLFVYEETVPQLGATSGPGAATTSDDQKLNDFARGFFARAARLLDGCDDG